MLPIWMQASLCTVPTFELAGDALRAANANHSSRIRGVRVAERACLAVTLPVQPTPGHYTADLQQERMRKIISHCRKPAPIARGT